jgi:hypothetical protein
MTRFPSAPRGTMLAAGAAALAASVLAACSTSDQENAGPCPNAFALHEAARVVEFRDPGLESYENVAYTAEIQAVRTFCRYVDDRPIRAELELEIGFGRGPAASEGSHEYPLWVAVTRTDVAVIDKQTTSVRVSFPRGEDRVFLRRTIDDIVIPRAGESTSGTNFEILVGFEVTPEQLEFNRLGKRFTLDAIPAGG